MPHKNYCQQCGKEVEPKGHDEEHNIITDVSADDKKKTEAAHKKTKRKKLG